MGAPSSPFFQKHIKMTHCFTASAVFISIRFFSLFNMIGTHLYLINEYEFIFVFTCQLGFLFGELFIHIFVQYGEDYHLY